MRRVPALLALLALQASIVACGNEDPGGLAAPPGPPEPAPVEDAGAPDAAPEAEAPPPEWEPTFPQVLSRGGPVIAAPKVVAIVFSGDPLTADIDTLTKKIAASQYWKGVGAEYGVGPITVREMIVVNEPAPTTITNEQIEAWLVQKLSTSAFGTPDQNTLYAVFYPAQTTITFEEAGAFGQSCQGYGGYHYEVDVAGKAIGYAVMPRCGGIDELSVTTSHEYFEWATDPFPNTNPAFNKLDDDHWAWQAAMIGELSDLCTFLDRDNLKPTEIGFVVQRHWSNKEALPGGYPCAPVKSSPYFQLIPHAEDEALVPDYGVGGGGTGAETIRTKAIRVAPGKSREVEMLVWSDKSSSVDVPLRVLAYNEFYGNGTSTGFTFDVEPSYAKPGEKVKLTITAPKARAYDIAIGLAYTGKQAAHFWPLLVTNDPAPKPATGGSKEPLVPTVTRETMPKRPDNLGFDNRARRGFGPRLDAYAPVRAAMMAAYARASLPSRMMTEIEPAR